ncbi:MAG: sensor histidine kinase [Opitutaceae bacterium]
MVSLTASMDAERSATQAAAQAGGDPPTDILIVDDVPDKLLAMEAILAPLGQNIVRVRSGRDALRLLLQREFTVIILDINMPGMDGFETASLLRQRKSCAHTPIIFVTSFSTADAEIYRGYSLGAVDYLFTPVVPDVLRSKVSVFIELEKRNREVRRQADALRLAEEERHQRQLQETHARLEWETRRNHFFRLSIELLAITDYQGVFAQTNPTWQGALGYSEEDLRGRPIHAFIHPDDAEPTGRVVKNILQADTPLYFESRFRHANGSYRWLAWTIAPFAAEKLLYVFARDVTEQHEREEQIRTLNESLSRQAQTLQMLNQELESFSYSISHDLRTPLRAISSYAGLLLAGEAGKLPEEADQILQAVSRNSQHMAQLIDDFLNFFRVGQQEVKPTAIDMVAAARDAIAAAEPMRVGRTVEFRVGALPPSRGDRAMIGQVLVNLVSNAVKFTSRHRKPRVEVGAFPKQTPAVYYVRDNGVGFSMEHYGKLFGVFQRLHNRSDFGGTGIGLAIVQKIIQRHGGRVWAEAEVDKGATFYFTLAPATAE